MKIKHKIEAAWEDYANTNGSIHDDGVVTYEHGQYWVICKCGASWSVGSDDAGGFEFEEIADGKDDYHLPTPEITATDTVDTYKTVDTDKTDKTAEITRLEQELAIIRLKHAIATEGPSGPFATKVIIGLVVLLGWAGFFGCFGFPLF
jgi:hypothetical protein